MTKIEYRPIELENLLKKDRNSYRHINFSKIIKEHLNYIQYTVGEGIEYCNKRKMSNNNFSIKDQEKDLLFEIEQYKSYFIHMINYLLPCVDRIDVRCEIKTCSGKQKENKVETQEIVIVLFNIEFFQPGTHTIDRQKYELQFSYYVNFISNRGWH